MQDANFLQPLQQRYQASLEHLLVNIKQKETCPAHLYAAIEYVLTTGGKAMRPNLVYLVGDMLGATMDVLDAAALAVELIHVYSLTHDDLPAMDDAAMRRGQTACHIQFNEATAILVGDALLPLAFEVISEAPLSAEQKLAMIKLLSEACGVNGMVAGQMMDLLGENCEYSLEEINLMHQLKTGAMINASIILAAIASDVSDKDKLAALEQFAATVGLAFQIQDDILDVTSSSEVLGKPAGIDSIADKSSYVAHRGLQQSTEDVAALRLQAIEQLALFAGRNQQLLDYVELIFSRES